MIYRSVTDLDFDVSDLASVDPPGRVLMTTPQYFDVQYVINPHMEGNVGTVDVERARSQWVEVRRAYETLGMEVQTVDGASGLPDMVFCANQTLPFRLTGGIQGVVLSRMHSEHRAPEVPYFERFFQSRDYLTHSLPETIPDFEGMGDALWHRGRELLWGGYGFRSSLDAYDYLAERLGVRVIALRLEDPDFYHLDTCLSIINESTALVFTDAFEREGLEVIRELFPVVIEAPEDESRSLFACNAHSPDGIHVIIQRGCDATCQKLRSTGLHPVEVDTDEFLKAGGSVFCMKQMFW